MSVLQEEEGGCGVFTKGDIRAALSVAIDINSDATERICNFSLTGVSDGIMLNVYPHGKRGGFGSFEGKIYSFQCRVPKNSNER